MTVTLPFGDFERPKPRSRGPWVHGPRLTDRDVEILRWITRHGVVTTELVGRKFFWRADGYGEWAAYRRLAALSRLGLIVRNANPFPARTGGRQALLRASRDGARLADVGLAEAPLVTTQLRHTLAVVALTEFLLERYPDADVTTERELRAQEYRRRYRGAPLPQLFRVPDALLRVPKQGGMPGEVLTFAVELDLTRKDRRAMEAMIACYDRMAIDRIWWYVKEVRLPAVRALVAELQALGRFEVLPVRWLD
jgi:hypothetical protein